MIQLNLLPDLKKEFIKAQKAKAMVITIAIFVTLGAFAVSALLFVYVTFIQQFQVNLASDDIGRKMKELKDIPDVDKYLTVQNQLASLPDLHNNKGQYSRLFDFLAVLNPSAPNNVTLTELRLGTDDKSILFTGTTASFQTLNTFVDTLKNGEASFKQGGQGDPITEKIFEQVLVQTADIVRNNNTTVVGFSVKTTYKESVFDVKNTDLTAKVPSITTTPSVTQSPNPLFNSNSGGAQ
jgi:Tfp pilus assembly protein PilN